MADQVVQINSTANQEMAVNLNVDGGMITLNLSFAYKEMAGYWILAIYDETYTLLVDSIPLVPGYYPAGNILGCYVHLHIGSVYLVNISNSSEDYPTQNTLATDWILIWSDTGEV